MVNIVMAYMIVDSMDMACVVMAYVVTEMAYVVMVYMVVA